MGIKENWQVSSKSKKVAIVAETVTLSAITIAVIVGLGFAMRQKPDKTLDLWLPWSEDKQYSRIMKDVVNEFNETHDGYDIKISFIDGYDGYYLMSNSFEKEIKTGAGGIKNLPELYLNYGDGTSKLANSSKNKNYAFNFQSKNHNIVSDSLKYVDSTLLEGDNNVLGLGEGIYRIPIAMSGEGMGIDSPLFVYLLQNFVNQGGTLTFGDGGQKIMAKILDSTDGNQDGKINASTDVYDWETSTEVSENITLDNVTSSYNAIPAKDMKNIQGKFIPNGKDKTKGITITIDDSTFNDWIKLEELGANLMKPFIFNEKTTNQNGINFLGLDSADNEFHQMATMINGGNGLTKIDGDKVDYDLIKEGTSSYTTLEKIYNDFFVKGVKDQALWIAYENEGGYMPYGSGRLVSHNIAMSIGSTAGLGYYADTNISEEHQKNVNPGQVVYTHSPQKFNDSETSSIVQQGPSIGAIDKYDSSKKYDNKIMDQALNFVSWFLNPDSRMTTISSAKDLSPSMYFSKNSNYISATTQVLDSGTELFGDETTLTGTDGKFKSQYSIGPKVAFDQLTQVKNGEAVGMNEVISNDSKTLRGVLKEGAIDAKKNFSFLNGTPSFDEFQKELSKSIKDYDSQFGKTKHTEVIIDRKEN